MKEFKIGDVVLVPCTIVGKGVMAYSEEPVLDLVVSSTAERSNNERKQVQFSELASAVIKQ